MKVFLNKLKKFILKNKLLSILILLFLLIFILGLVAIKILIFPSYKVSKYGNRLSNIESVKLDDTRFNEVKNDFGSVDGFSIDSFRLSGKIVNIIVKVDDEISTDKIKSNASKLVSSFSDDEKKYYDFQVFVTKNDGLPMIGYKNKNSEGLSWNYVGEN